MKDYIFFDLDGTLTDSREGIFYSLRQLLDHFGIKKTDEELMPFLGPSLWESLPEFCGFNLEQCREGVEIYRKSYNSEGIFINKLYPGVKELLEKLKDAGKHLAVATGKPVPQAEVVVNHFKLTDYFDFVGGSEDKTRSKKGQVIEYVLENLGFGGKNAAAGSSKTAESPEKSVLKDRSRVIMVGDRNNDIYGAHENGIEVAAALYGYGSQKEFEEAGADYVCETVEDLGELLMHRSL